MRRHPALFVGAFVLLHVLLSLLTFEPQPHTGGDNAAYITLGRSLIDHGAYLELWDPATPPHTKYPPAFPALLGIALALGLAPWVQLKFVALAFSATAVAFTFLFLRARRRPLLAVGVTMIVALAPGVLREGRWILSDVPFWMFTMIALWAFERLRPGDWKRFAIAAAAITLAYLTRSAGLPLLLAALAWLALRRRWRQLGALGIIAGAPALWWWLRSRAYGPAGYVNEFWLVDPYTPALGRIGAGDLVQRMIENVGKYVSIHLPVLLTGTNAARMLLPAIGIVLLAVAGWALHARRARVADLFVPLYAGLILIWPAVWSGERFLLPLLPLLLYFAGEMLLRLLRRATPRFAVAGTAALAALLVMTALPGLAQSVRIGRACTAQYRAGNPYPCLVPQWTDFFDMATVVAEGLPDDAVVLSRKPRLFYVLSGAPGRNYPMSDDPVTFFATADSIGARYVIFDRLGGLADRYLRPVLLARPGAFCVLTATPVTGTVLFGIRPAAARGGTATGVEEAFVPCPTEYWRDAQAEARFGAE